MTNEPGRKQGSRTWTFVPDETSKSLVRKKISRMVGRKNANCPKAIRGLRTKILNDALRKLLLTEFGGKREANA